MARLKPLELLTEDAMQKRTSEAVKTESKQDMQWKEQHEKADHSKCDSTIHK